MLPICLHRREKIATFLLACPDIHIYELGDLDDFFWKYTSWYACECNEEIQNLALIYTGTDLPILLSNNTNPGQKEFLKQLLPILPRRFYAHLTPGLEEAFSGHYSLVSYGQHLKMILTHPDRLLEMDPSVQQLKISDLPALSALYAVAYPENWFDPRMLETGQYYGIWQGNCLISVAGIHVYSPHYRVAALGNITTHPQYRGMGLGTLVTSCLCQSLRNSVDRIGLNVHAENSPAIACYRKLGFEPVAPYVEWMAEAIPGVLP